MKNLILTLLLLIGFKCFSQEYKDDITICQFSSSFTSDADIDLKVFKDNFFYNFKIEKDKKIFDAENVKYLPTVIVFSNGKEILRLESGISMKLPEDSKEQIEQKINSLIESKF